MIFLLRVIIKSQKNIFSLSFIFSILSFFLVVFPLLIDSFMFFIGNGREWVFLLNSTLPVFPYIINANTLFDIALFVMLFNFIVLLRIEKNVVSNEFILRYFFKKRNENIDLFKLLLIFSYLGFLFYVYVYGFSLSDAGFGNTTSLNRPKSLFDSILIVVIQTLLPLSAIPFFFYYFNKKFILSFFSVLPVLLITYYTNERTHIVPHIIFFLFGYLLKVQFSIFKLVKIFLLGFFIFYFLRFIRIGFENPLEFIVNNLYPVYRDDSSSNLYYSFDRFDQLSSDFKGLYKLLFIDSSTSFDVTKNLAEYRVNWEEGSLHPTLYGWAYIDMKWYGLFLALIYRICFYAYNSISVNYNKFKIILFPIFILFIVVSLRGSVQFAWSHFLYSFVLLMIIMFLLRRK